MSFLCKVHILFLNLYNLLNISIIELYHFILIINFKINTSTLKSHINEDFEVDKDIFYINSISYDKLYPRIQRKEYTEMKNTEPIMENIGTFKDLEDLEENIEYKIDTEYSIENPGDIMDFIETIESEEFIEIVE
mgnify:CR=1 FL=1